MSACGLVIVSVLTWLGASLAQRGVAYAPGGCLVTSQGDSGVNVTCRCGQTLRQTAITSPAIDHLTVLGCGDAGETTLISLLPRPDDPQPDRLHIMLRNVHSVRLTGGIFSLTDISGGGASADNPLQELTVEDAQLGAGEEVGLPAGALQSLPQLRHVSLVRVNTTALVTGSLSDLPHLETLEVSQCSVDTMDTAAVVRTPRLRHLHISHTQFQLVHSHAIVVEAAGGDVSACAAAQDVSFLIAHCSFAVLSPAAIRFGGVQHLVLDDNSIYELQKASLSVTTQARCGRAARLQLTHNVADVVLEAPNVIIVNDGEFAAPFVHGGNELEPAKKERRKQDGTFPPPHLRLAGRFSMTRINKP